MDNCKNSATELCITVGSNAFLRLQRKTSHVVLLAVYRAYDYISLMSLVMFPEGGQSVTIVQRCQEFNINLCVSYLVNILDKQNYGLYDSNLH